MSSSSSSSSSNSHVPRDHELEILINDVKARIRKFYGGIKEQIERTGNFLKEKKLVKERDICIEIKSYLKEEIKDQIISERTIDRCCPDEWKHKTRPKKERQVSFFEDKNLQVQETVTNTGANLTSEGQILQQDLELGDKSNKSNEQKPKEIKMNLSEGVQKNEDVQITRERELMELKRLKMENEQQRQEIELLRSELGKLEKQKQQRDVSSCSTIQGINTKDPKYMAHGKVQSYTSPKVPKEQNKQNLLDIDIFIKRDQWWEHFITPLASKSGDIIRAKFVFDKLTQIATITIE